MIRRTLSLVAALLPLLALASEAAAQSTLDNSDVGDMPGAADVDGAGLATAEGELTAALMEDAATSSLRGYLRSEYQRPFAGEGRLANALGVDADGVQPFLEANVELSHRRFGDRLKLYADGGFVLAPTAVEIALVLNEVSVEVTVHEHVAIWAGKRRLSFATGLAFTPSDLVNPRRDPVDPSLQRAGRFGAGIAVPFDLWTAHAAWYPEVAENDHDVPDAYDGRAGTLLAALAMHALATDLTLSYAGTVGASDRALQHEAAASVSRYVLDDLELHGEVAWVDAALHEVAPAALVGTDDGHDLSVLVGGRYSFLDTKGLVALEYLHNGQGLDRARFAALYDGLEAFAAQASASGAAPSSMSSRGAAAIGTGELRRDYLALSLQGSELWDRFSPALTLLWGADDNTILAHAALDYRLTDAVVLRAGGSAIFGGARSEAELSPFSQMLVGRVWVYF